MPDQADQASDPTLEDSVVPDAEGLNDSTRRGNYTFIPADRIRKKSEYAAVFADSRKVVDRFFICYLSKQEQEESKLGLAVSRKVGKAVIRNRVKRYLREFYRTHRSFLKAPCHIVVVARPAAATLSYAECTCAMKRLLTQAGVFND